MDNPTNSWTVIFILPYKIKERWHTEAFDIKERKGRRARFVDLVNFIDHQAKIVMDSLFGNISDSCPITAGKMEQKERQPAKKEFPGRHFATNVVRDRQPHESYVKPIITGKSVSTFNIPCLYCQQSHPLATCSKIKNQKHKDQVECFG